MLYVKPELVKKYPPPPPPVRPARVAQLEAEKGMYLPESDGQKDAARKPCASVSRGQCKVVSEELLRNLFSADCVSMTTAERNPLEAAGLSTMGYTVLPETCHDRLHIVEDERHAVTPGVCGVQRQRGFMRGLAVWSP